MTDRLFKFVGWDQVMDWGIQFYNCTLVANLGPFKAGDKIDSIFVNFESGTFEFYDYETNIIHTGVFKLEEVK